MGLIFLIFTQKPVPPKMGRLRVIANCTLFWVGVIFLFLIFLLPRPFGEGVKLERIFTIKARAADYQEGIQLWWKKPILGYGYNRLRYIKKTDKCSHAGAAFSSSFLTLLVASGVIGLIGLIGLIGQIFRQTDQLARTIILVATIASLFDNVLLNNFILLLFLVIISVSFI
jgi:O-antigen ligase